MTITVELSEEHYWILAQAVSAAGTASHRHGMEKHAERFHEAEKNLFRAYEQKDSNDGEDEDGEYCVKIYRGQDVTHYGPLSADGMTQTVQQLKMTYPNATIEVDDAEGGE